LVDKLHDELEKENEHQGPQGEDERARVGAEDVLVEEHGAHNIAEVGGFSKLLAFFNPFGYYSLLHY
jgi:hypothetical protein